MSASAATLTVVGDVHRVWRDADREFLEAGGTELAMFVGDLGDEDLGMAEQVAALQLPKVVLLGNHDAWQSFSNKAVTPRLRRILEVLGPDHLAYGVREVPRAGISVVGARPFSWGGQSLRSPEVYTDLYGLHTMRQSAVKIVEAARLAQHRDLVILAHNMPLGLGGRTSDIAGKDFGKPGGDWGDRDLALALPRIEAMGLRVRAVIAGHMHDRLIHPRGGERTRFVRRGDTMFVNSAVVPRIRADADGVELACFLQVRWRGGQCQGLEEVWVDPAGTVRRRREPQFTEVAPDPASEQLEDETPS